MVADIKTSTLHLKSSTPNKLIFSAFFITVAIAIITIPHYWEYSPPPLSKSILTGITKEGHPWIGAEQPKLTIDEYTDYQCFQCYKTHYNLRQLIAKYPDRIRLVHHHYPMDNEVNSVVVPEPFHVGSGKMAQLAIYALSKQKFWQINDLLYELGRNKKSFNLKIVSEKIEIPEEELAWSLESKEVKEILRYDIWHGMKLGITGTPAFVIEGKVYSGTIPPEIIKGILY
ncbi:MAG: thioredoxin domain-containing protein [Desulfobulbus sp.]|nr:thioredoxin domain-containing protein [Desulfobulbus sp.]